jgi:hypothetical protein
MSIGQLVANLSLLSKMDACEQKNNAPISGRFICNQGRAFSAHRFLFVIMSFLSTTLQRRAEIRHLNQTDIARQSGISRSNISRLFGGEFSDMSDDNFAALLNVFVADPQAQAEIIAARCEDTLEVARAARIRGAELVKISVRTLDAKADTGAVIPGVQLSAETERAFAWLRNQCPLNPDLEKHLVGYAKLMGM